jgi:uncharacterized protein YabE (DUF348 family)
MSTKLEQKIIRLIKKHQSGALVLASVVLFVLIGLSQIIPTHAALSSKRIPKGGVAFEHALTRIAVSFDGQAYQFFSRADSLGEAFLQQGIVLDHRDQINPGLKTHLFGDDLNVDVEKAKPVTIIDGHLRFETKACGKTVGEICQFLGLKIYSQDIVLPSLDSQYALGSEIVIERAKQILIITPDRELKVRTSATTVLDVLKEFKISLHPGELVKPELDKSIVDRGVIHVFGEGEELLWEKILVPAALVYKDDPNLSVGEQLIVQRGSDGEKEQLLKIVRDGRRILKYEVLSERILYQPRPTIVRRGTKVGGTTLVGTATWYGPGFYGNHTANGEILDKTSLTAAHLSLPFGTRVKVINLYNGKSCIVRINDRGPFGCSHIIDLSVASKNAIGMNSVALVRLEILR